MDEKRPEWLVLSYTRLMMAVLLFEPNPSHIGFVGLGGGSLPKYCYRYIPQASITVAEIHPEVIALRDLFHIPPNNDRFNILEADGAEFVASRRNEFDILMIDAFDHDGQPTHLCTEAFYQACHEALSPNGYLVVNLCHHETLEALSRLEQVFGKRTFFLQPPNSSNLIVIAGKNEGDTSSWARFPVLRAKGLEQLHPLPFQAMARSFIANPLRSSSHDLAARLPEPYPAE